MKHFALTIVAGLFCVSSAFAAKATYWQGGDGNWSDPTKWDNGVPTNTDYNAVLKGGDADITVTLDVDVALNALYVQGTTQEKRVRLTGTKTLTMGNLELYAAAALVVDGPAVTSTIGAFSKGYLEIHAGSWNHTGSVFWSSDVDSHFVVSGGDFTAANRFGMYDNATATFTMTAGSFTCKSFEPKWVTTKSSVWPTATRSYANPVKITGGLFNVSGGSGDGNKLQLPGPSTAYEYGTATNAVYNMQFYGTKTAATAPRYYGTGPVIVKNMVDAYDWGASAAIPHGIQFCSVGDWYYNRRITFGIRDFCSIDTRDYFDPTATHSVTWSYWDGACRHVDWSFTGGGTVTMNVTDNMVPFGGFGMLGDWTIGEGTTVKTHCPKTTTVNLRNVRYHVADFTLGKNAKLYLSPKMNYIQPSGTATFEAGSTVYAHVRSNQTYSVEDGQGTGNGLIVLVIGAGPLGYAKDINCELYEENFGSAPAEWHLTNIVNCVLLHNGVAPTPDTTKKGQWIGGVDSNFSTAGNWSTGEAPNLTNNDANINLHTLCGEIVNDVDNCKVPRFNTTVACGPVRISGKPIEITGGGNNRGSASAIDLYSFRYPLVFNCDIKGTGTDWFSTAAGNYSAACYVAYMKKLDCTKPKHFQVYGHVIVGGEAYANDLYITAQCGYALASMLEIAKGGNMVISNQTTALSYAAGTGFRVNKGGRLAFASGTLSYGADMSSYVGGDLEVAAIGSASSFGLNGPGNVYLGTTKSTDTAVTVSIADRLHLYPSEWNTVTADGEGPITLKIETWATLGATNDWRYGVADGATTETTADDRALVIGDHETLFVDTQSPKDGLGYTITFDDPIVATNGFLVKKGLGTLALESAGNKLDTTKVTIEKGVLAIDADQTFGGLEFKSGAVLAPSTEGTLPVVTVNSDVDVSNVTVAFSDATCEWQDLIVVPEGCHITGKAKSVGDKLKFRVVTLPEGGAALRVTRRAGLVLFLF